jgi:hypothetical protein
MLHLLRLTFLIGLSQSENCVLSKLELFYDALIREQKLTEIEERGHFLKRSEVF